MYLLITENALNELAQNASPPLRAPFETGDNNLLTHTCKEEDYSIIYSKKDVKVGEYYVLTNSADLERLPAHAAKDVFMRLARSLRASAKAPVRLPTAWSEYHAKSLISFFAIPRYKGSSYRWIAEIRNEDHALFFHTITTGTKIVLEEYDVPKLYINTRQILDSIIESNIQPQNVDIATSISPKVDLQVLGSTAISKDKTFDNWQEYLSDQQKSIIYDYPHKSIRLVGPAGSGKTLTLCLKAIQESRALGIDSQEKILFVTHSWAMAERIDATLCVLNGHVPPCITVLPLLEILRDILNKQNIAIDVLGEDSADGRQRQIEYIDQILSEFSCNETNINKIDWINPISVDIKKAIFSAKSSLEYRELIENIYLEIYGSLSAKGILPNDNLKI